MIILRIRMYPSLWMLTEKEDWEWVVNWVPVKLIGLNFEKSFVILNEMKVDFR